MVIGAPETVKLGWEERQEKVEIRGRMETIQMAGLLRPVLIYIYIFRKTSQDHSNLSNFKIGQNTEKSLGDLRKQTLE